MVDADVVERIAFLAESIFREVNRNKNLLSQNCKPGELKEILNYLKKEVEKINKINCRPLGKNNF